MAKRRLEVEIVGDQRQLDAAVEQSSKSMGKLGDIMKAGGLAAGAALSAGILSALDTEAANDKLAAQLGLTTKESARFGKVAGDLYANAYGDSLETVNVAIRGVVQEIGGFRKASDADLKSVTASVLDIAQAFDQDVGAVTRAVGQSIKTGLAPNAKAALDIITVGFQKGADKSEDFLDTLNEYGTQFRKVGIDGKTATGLISQGLRAGARDADIVADAIKEFSIRAVDGSEDTKKGFEAIGLNAKDMAAQIAKGGPAAEKGLDTVLDRLRKVEDPTRRAQIATKLFGTQAEDLGKALFALDPSKAAAGLGKVGGAADKMGKILSDNASTRIETFKRKALHGLGEIAANEVIPALEGIWKELQPMVRWLGRGAKAIGEFADKHPEVKTLAAAVIGVGLAIKGLKFVSAVTGFSALLGAGRKAMAKLVAMFAAQGTVAGAAAGTGAAEGMASKSILAKFKGKGRLLGGAFGLALGAAAIIAIGKSDFASEIGRKINNLLPGKDESKAQSKWVQDLFDSNIDSKEYAKKHPIPKATGGLIPGTGTGDTFPALLTPGEFVIRKQVVDRFGPTFFAGLNGTTGKHGQRAVPGFSDGGIVARANKLDGMGLPYLWGGGHGGPINRGVDCSGAVSYALGVSPRVSGAFASFGLPGAGGPMDTKIYANAQHVFAVFDGKGWGTSKENPGGGPGWLSYNHRDGFTIRHLEDGASSAARAASAGDPQEPAESGKRTAALERAGSRLVNKLAAPFMRNTSGFAGPGRLGSRSLGSLASSLGTQIDDASTRYGQTQRAFDQTDEDLGTAAGRDKRLSEIKALKELKRAQLNRQHKRAAALKARAGKLSGLIKAINAKLTGKNRIRGVKAAKIRERRKTYEDDLIEVMAELKSLGFEIQDTLLDIGDLEKDAAAVATTPDTPVDAPAEAEVAVSQTPSEKLGDALSLIDLRERAGELSAADAKTNRVQMLQAALGSGMLQGRERLEALAALRDAMGDVAQATTDLSGAMKDLKASIDAQLAFGDRVSAITSLQAVRAMADVMSGQLGYSAGARATMPGSGQLSRL